VSKVHGLVQYQLLYLNHSLRCACVARAEIVPRQSSRLGYTGHLHHSDIAGTSMGDHSKRVYDSILGLLSNAENPTPIVALNRVVPFKHARVYAKLEWYNPFGSVKDRVAHNLLVDAEERGELRPNQLLVEPTSGNTGMGLTMVSNERKYSLTTPLSSAIPQEKRTMLNFFGATVIELDDALCPAPGAPEGAIARAQDLASRPEFHMLNQYTNQANPGAHYRTTGPEIWRQTDGKITHFVAGLGTCGTITGTGRFLKEKNPEIKVLGIHPVEGHDIPGVRSIKQLAMTELFSPDEYDGLFPITNQQAFDLCLRLNREESIIAGPSSAMALAGALEAVPDEPGVVAVVIFPDNAFKYASSVVKHLPELNVEPKLSRDETMMKALIENARENPAMNIGLDDAHALWEDESALIIDVRDFEQWAGGHLPRVHHVPNDDLKDYVRYLPEDRNAPILTVCNRGNMSLSGALILSSLGFTNVRSIQKGTFGWKDRGYPVEKYPAE
jgi:cysteine synthase/rhodanese-related sulfurtransferase